jgi:hypothetical protein
VPRPYRRALVFELTLLAHDLLMESLHLHESARETAAKPPAELPVHAPPICMSTIMAVAKMLDMPEEVVEKTRATLAALYKNVDMHRIRASKRQKV